ncbi:MAG: TetR/AcrR family transcriptional regulator [Alphaproteobacteria bacterium]|nr:TetR/AcrR family transcriptional regulator [Alphaproteobacteria bacterium]
MAKALSAAAKNGLRAQILDESAKLFIAHGFNGTTINDIAASLNVTRTNIYYYFKDKKEILEELTGDIFLTGRMIARKAAEPRSDPVVALRELVEIFARVVLSNPVRFRVIERNEGYFGPELRTKVAAARKKLFNDFRSVIQEGISSGAFRPVDAGSATLAIIGMCSWAALWYHPDPRRPVDSLIQFFVDFALNALVPAAGRQRSRRDARGIIENVRNELAYLEKALS